MTGRAIQDQFCAEDWCDKWIAENLSGALPQPGFYLDIGCANPDRNSNTHFLRNRGWLGLAIDAHPGYAQFWKNNFVQAVLSPNPIVPFSFEEVPTMSRIGEGKNCMLVAAVRLDSILAALEIKRIDFISIDADGHEYDIFQSFDVEAYKPRVIVAEYDTLGIGQDWRLAKMLEGGGNYRAVHKTHCNVVFLRKPEGDA